MITDDLAKRIADDFIQQEIGGCKIERYHNHGASGVILYGRDGEDQVAVKIYGKHLINEAPQLQADIELERIKRQVELARSPHPNIVRTRRAGQCSRTEYHYLVMDFVDDKTLEEVLSDIPRERIRAIIRDIAKATLFLQQSLEHVHRDIKPSNIAINLSTHHVTLLDLGLVRPVVGETATDQAPRFVGTKRYASPEFFNSSMKKDERGWNAVSFYQLGGILYSMITRKPLFEEYQGDDLIRAIEKEVPLIEANDVPADLVKLARDCLLKDADARSSLVSWDRFMAVPDPNAAGNEADRLRNVVRRLTPPANRGGVPPVMLERHAIESAFVRVSLDIDYHFRSLLNSDESLYPHDGIVIQRLSERSFAMRTTLSYEDSISVTVFVHCQIQDPISLLCECAISGGPGNIPDYPSSGASQIIFVGSFVAEAFAESLDQAIPKIVANYLSSQSQAAR